MSPPQEGAAVVSPDPPKSGRERKDTAKLLRRLFAHKDIGWGHNQEEFTRFYVVRNRFFQVYIHRLYAPTMDPDCHDHPWSFLTFILWGGYYERTRDGRVKFRFPGSILYRPATFAHSVMTTRPCWSFLILSPKKREWGTFPCVSEEMDHV